VQETGESYYKRQGSCSARYAEEEQCKRQGNDSAGKGGCCARDSGVVVQETGEL
jgi:hypothetical protein